MLSEEWIGAWVGKTGWGEGGEEEGGTVVGM